MGSVNKHEWSRCSFLICCCRIVVILAVGWGIELFSLECASDDRAIDGRVLVQTQIATLTYNSTGTEIVTTSAPVNPIAAVLMAKEGFILADGFVKIWPTSKPTAATSKDTSPGGHLAAAWSSNYTELIALRRDRTLVRREISSGRSRQISASRILNDEDLTENDNCIFSPNGTFLAIFSGDQVKVVNDGAVMKRLSLPRVNTGFFSADCKRLYYGGGDTVAVWDSASNKSVNLFVNKEKPPSDNVIRFWQVGNLSASRNEAILCWRIGPRVVVIDRKTEKVTRHTISSGFIDLWSVTVSPDGDYVAAVFGRLSPEELKVWRDRKPKTEVKLHHCIAVLNMDGTVLMEEIETLRQASPIAVSPDGRHIAYVDISECPRFISVAEIGKSKRLKEKVGRSK